MSRCCDIFIGLVLKMFPFRFNKQNLDGSCYGVARIVRCKEIKKGDVGVAGDDK